MMKKILIHDKCSIKIENRKTNDVMKSVKRKIVL